jgi:anthranilate phosphoribosyltransferase
VKRQLVGVARPELVPVYAEAMTRLEMERAMILCGEEGVDELCLAGRNFVSHVRGTAAADVEIITAVEAGLPPSPISAIRGGDAAENAAALRGLLEGEKGAYRDAVLLNAAAALMVAGEASSLRNGVEEAAEAIDKGIANALLNCWIAWT